MEKTTVLEPGKLYRLKMRGVSIARFQVEEKLKMFGRTVTRYHFRNVRTGRDITVHSKRVIKSEVQE